MRVNRQTYERLIQENIAAIEASNCQRLEAMHSRLVMLESVEMHYEILPAVKKLIDHIQLGDLPEELREEVAALSARIQEA